MGSRSKAPFGASLIVMSSVFYASYGVWAKLMGDFFGSFTASAIRCLLVCVILLFVALFRRNFKRFNWNSDCKYIVVMIAASILVSGPLYYSILHAGIGISIALSYIGIVLGMFIMGRLTSGEKYTPDKLVATILGVSGIILIFSPNIHSLGWLALIAALVSGLSTSINMSVTKLMPYNPLQSTILLWATGIVANLPMAVILHEHKPSFGLHIQWLYMLLFCIASVIASWTFVKGLKLIENGMAGILGLLEVVFGVLFGVLFFSERPGAGALFGILSILAAASIPYLQEYKNKLS